MEKEIEKIRQEVENCKKCDLWRSRNKPVIGEGNINAKIIFIGEAPGFNEDKQGKPFVGKAGKIFDELLDSVNLKRGNIYITNIIKCRPPKNRNPKEDEINTCSLYLNKQIEIINPKIICCLGNFATSYILKKFGLKDKIQGISKIHGRVFSVSSLFGLIKIIPLYHPAVVTYDINMLNILKKDFENLRDKKAEEEMTF